MSIPFLLLAEDDEDDRFLFSQAIKLADPQIVCAMVSNGKELITLLKNDFFSLPDYIFLDLNMPVMNGWESLATIKRDPMYKSCIVIIYSTTLDKETEEKFLNAGASACFVKPTSVGELAALLRNFCGL